MLELSDGASLQVRVVVDGEPRRGALQFDEPIAWSVTDVRPDDGAGSAIECADDRWLVVDSPLPPVLYLDELR